MKPGLAAAKAGLKIKAGPQAFCGVGFSNGGRTA